MKKIILILMAIMLTLIPVASFAETPVTTGTGIGGVKTTLTVYELPELSPLEMPSLSKNYENMAEDMVDLGFGNYRFENGLPLPDVEAPAGAGTNAYDIFVNSYGDLWSDPNRQLNKESTLPVQEVLNAAASFSLQAQTSFNTIKSKDSETMAKLLATKLDTSKNWDLAAIKSSLPTMSANAMNTYLAGATKPSTWGTKAAAPSATDQLSNMYNLASKLGVDAETMLGQSKEGFWESAPEQMLSQGLGIDGDTANIATEAGKTIASIASGPAGIMQVAVSKGGTIAMKVGEGMSIIDATKEGFGAAVDAKEAKNKD